MLFLAHQFRPGRPTQELVKVRVSCGAIIAVLEL
jgi:hypothetical protein